MRKTNALRARLCDGRFRSRGMLCLLLLIAEFSIALAETPDTVDEEDAVVWAGRSRLGITTSRRAVVERDDGSILIAGDGNFQGTQGIYLLALSPRGEALWQRAVGGGQLLHESLGLRAISDGSTLVLARVVDRSRRGGVAPWLGRLAADGSLLWERRIDGDGVGRVWGFDAFPDGSSVMAGWGERPEAWVVKIDPLGRAVWGRTLVRSGVKLQPYDVECTRDGGAILTGTLDFDIWVAKLDSDGDLEWSIRAGNPEPGDIGWGTVQTGDGGYLVAGETESMGADGVLWMLRLDARGRAQWQGGLGGPRYDVPRTVAPDPDGGIWVLGSFGSRAKTRDARPPWLVHIGADGVILAESLVTEPGVQEPNVNEWSGITATRDGGAAVAMRLDGRGSRWRLRVLKVDSSGRTARNYPWIELLESPLKSGELTVRPAPLEWGRLDARSTEVTSVQLEIPFDHARGWEFDAPIGPPHPRRPPAPRSLKPLVTELAESVDDTPPSQLLIDGRFNAIEQRAAEFIRTQAKNENGRWELPGFYEELAVDSEPLLGFGLERSLGYLEYWQQKRPDSITARVALAAAYIDVAWEHRGAGLGREVTSEAWAEVRKNIRAASELLTPLYSDRPDDPMYWVVLLTIAHIGGPSPAPANEILATGLEIAPDFIHLYVTEVVFLRPQWGGGRCAIERFAAEMSDRRAATLGDELYARVAMELYYSEPDSKIFGEHCMKWPRVKSGMELIRERYPSRWNIHMSARLAILAEDREEAYLLLTSEGAEYGDDVAKIWYSAKSFDGHVAWAMLRPAGDWARQPVGEWPSLALPIERGDDPRPDGNARVGFLVSRPGGEPLLISAVDLPVYEQGHPEATLDRLALPERIAAWHVVPADRDGEAFSGLRAVGLRTPPRTNIDPRVVLARLPDKTVDPGVPALPVVQGEDLKNVWVVGCAEGRPGCVQQLVKGRASGNGWDTDSTTVSVTVEVDERGLESTRLGAPVLDELGRVLGVVAEKWQTTGSEYMSPDFKLRCLVLENVLPLIDSEGPYLVPSRSPAGQSAVLEAALKLIEEGRWDELRWLAETTRNLRADDGSWVGLGVLDASTRCSVSPPREPGRRPFDAVGAALEDWVKLDPSDPVASVLAMSHFAAKGPEVPEGVTWSWDEWKEYQRAWCENMVGPVEAMVAELPDDVYAHVVAVRFAASCRGFDETLEALAGLASVAPDLTPVFQLALTESNRQTRWTLEELSAAIERAVALGGPEVSSTLYGLMMKLKLRYDQEVDPVVDLDRVVANLESWIELYPGGFFDEANLLNVLCIKGDVAKAAVRLDITHCREVTVSGSAWSKKICEACFGGDLIPRPTESAEFLDGN